MGTKQTPRIFDLDPKNAMDNSSVSRSFVDSNYADDPGDARFFGIFVGFLVVGLGAIGNGVTIWAYTRNKNLQTSFNRLIANLCCVDFLSSAVVIPLMLPGYVVGENVYSYGVCSLIGYLYYVLLASSLYNLVAIAVNRYIGIVWSKSYQKLFSGQRLALCIASIWLVPAILYLPIATGGGIKWTNNTLRCGIHGQLHPALKWYNLSLNVTFQAIGLLILIILYTAIFQKVKQVKRKMKGHQHKSVKSGSKPRKTASSASSTILKNRSGYTSEETGDAYKPSSLLDSSGAHQVLKLPEQKNAECQKEKYYHTDDTEDDERSKSGKVNESTTLSLEDRISDSPLDALHQPKKRSAILGLFSRGRKSSNAQYDFAFKAKMNEVVAKAYEEQRLKTQKHILQETDGAQESNGCQIALRDKVAADTFSRKKSLSAPDLTRLDAPELEMPREVSVDPFILPAILPHRELNTDSSLPPVKQAKEDLKLKGNKNNKKTSKSVNRSQSICGNQSNGHPAPHVQYAAPKASWSVRIKKTTRDWVSNLSLSSSREKENYPGNRPRVGTTARLAHDRRAKEEHQKRKRQRRNRILRKKHARERQLVYSSFTICIVFAICNIPTALLYLVQVLANKPSPAIASLVVGCIAWLHAMVNPMIYGYMNTQYRREYSKIAHQLTSKPTCCTNR